MDILIVYPFPYHPFILYGPELKSPDCQLSEDFPNNDNNDNNNNNTIYLQLAEGIAKANKGQLYTTLLIFSKITKMNSIKRKLDTDAAITFKSLPTFDFILNSLSFFAALYRSGS